MKTPHDTSEDASPDPRTLGITTKVFLAFAGLLVVFGAVLAWGVYRLHEVQRDTRLIHHSYVPLSLTLSEAHTDLATYDAVLGERDKAVLKRVVQAQKVLYPFAARVNAKLIRASEFVETGQDLAHRSADAQFLNRAAEDIDALLEQVADFEDDSEAFRKAVLTESWDAAYKKQQKLRGTASVMQRTLRDLSRAARAEISDSIGRANASEREALAGIIILSVVAAIIAFIVMFVVHRTLRPIKELTDATRRFGRGEYAGRVDVSRRDELGRLASEFNRMADSIEARDRTLRERRDELEAAYARLVELREQEERTKAELIKKERLAAIGRMTSQVTHELRNPLSSLGLNVEMLEDELNGLGVEEDAEARELLAAVVDEVERLTEITEEYLAYARLPVARPRGTDVNEILKDLTGFMREEFSNRDITADVALQDELPRVMADPNQLRRGFLNLIRNAMDAMEGGGTLSVSTRLDGESAVIEVGDSGPGIPQEELDRIFDPFFSTKDSGTGLGLPLTAQIIEEHGGRILVASQMGAGSVFKIELPLAPGDDDAPVSGALDEDGVLTSRA